MITSHALVETEHDLKIDNISVTIHPVPKYCQDMNISLDNVVSREGELCSQCVCVYVKSVPSCEWGNQICEALEWGPPRKEGEEGEDGGREGCDG